MKGYMTAVLTLTRDGAPLAVVDLPGEGAELTMRELRVLATALQRVADDAEARKLTGRDKLMAAEPRVYPLTS